MLQEFRRAIRVNARQDVVDLDSKFALKFDFQIQRIEHIFENTKRAIPRPASINSKPKRTP
jgi:hypothetical protein